MVASYTFVFVCVCKASFFVCFVVLHAHIYFLCFFYPRAALKININLLSGFPV